MDSWHSSSLQPATVLHSLTARRLDSHPTPHAPTFTSTPPSTPHPTPTPTPPSSHHPEQARLDWVLLDAGLCIFYSIAVGAAGLAAGGLSPWLVVSHFGLFCALELTVQLLLALVLLPANP